MKDHDFDNCQYIQEQLHFLNDAAVAPAHRQAIDAHLAGCAACRSEWQDLQRLLLRLKRVQVEPMRAGFADAAFARVREYEEQRAAPWLKPMLGVAASVLLVGAVLILNKPVDMKPQPYEVVTTMPSSIEQVHDLRIAFNSPGLLENVGIEIILPESVSLEGSELQKISWQTNLYKGKNELKLPLKSSLNSELAAREEFVLARLTHGDKVKEFRVRLLRSEQA